MGTRVSQKQTLRKYATVCSNIGCKFCRSRNMVDAREKACKEHSVSNTVFVLVMYRTIDMF